MKTKLRVAVWARKNHPNVYIPQYKWLFWWRDFTTTNEGGGSQPIFFEELERAKQFILGQADSSRNAGTVSYVYIDKF